MRLDPMSNYIFAQQVPPASLGTGDHNSGMVDHAQAHSASFIVSVGDIGTGGTVDAKLQYSDDGSSWNDEPDDQAGNTVAIDQITASNEYAMVHAPNPRGRYSRVVVSIGNNSVVASVSSMLGPRRHNTPA